MNTSASTFCATCPTIRYSTTGSALCDLCAPNHFWHPRTQICEVCGVDRYEGAWCPTVGLDLSSILLKPGYWRVIKDSDELFHCDTRHWHRGGTLADASPPLQRTRLQVFVLIDDMGYNDMGYQSSDLGQLTPHMNALRASATTFLSAHAQTALSPTASPRRRRPRRSAELWRSEANSARPPA